MSDATHQELIIIKRPEEDEHEAHSSAWKVAHADFMTAMMAFFLIMWLISVTDDEVRKGISAYFNPIKLADGLADLKGLNKPSTTPGDDDKKRGRKDEAPPENFNPMKLSVGHSDTSEAGAEHDKGEGDDTTVELTSDLAASAGAKKSASESEAGASSKSVQTDEHGAAAKEVETDDPGAEVGAPGAKGAENPGASEFEFSDGDEALEHAAFQDPYAVLAKIEEDYEAGKPMSVDALEADSRKRGVVGGDVDRDPFDPAYWQLTPTPPARADNPGEPGAGRDVDPLALPDAGAPVSGLDAKGILEGLFPRLGPGDGSGEHAEPRELPAEGFDPIAEIAAQQPVEEVAPAAEAADQAASRETSDEAQTPLDVRPAEFATGQSPEGEAREPAADAASEIEEAAAVAVIVDDTDGPVAEVTVEAGQAIGDSVGRAVAATTRDEHEHAPAVSVRATAEGVLIDLTDEAGFSMFGIGSAVPTGEVVVLMDRIAEILAREPGEIILRGHTDARPFRSKTYDNWRLSAARAQMAYYMLTRGGLNERRVVAIEGYADRDLLKPDDPFAAENRRIEILIKAPRP